MGFTRDAFGNGEGNEALTRATINNLLRLYGDTGSEVFSLALPERAERLLQPLLRVD